MTGGTFLFDSEGLSQLFRGEEKAVKRLDLARKLCARAVISALTIPEADHAAVRRERVRYVLAKLEIEPVTEEIALQAAGLLREHGLHGHKYAIDAVVAATALRMPGPVIVYTSDLDDMLRFCTAPERSKQEQVKVIRT
ncbi:PIN domain-containing protein [Kitasatospora sp. NPDC006697]|uniref:PIN domain-containing protein n=1 Tax=Kitasatospora sp. NPDC006697 TaxID=3364020 RepID=UPI0036981109